MIKRALWGAALVILFSTTLFAQGPVMGSGRGHGFGKRGCSSFEAMGLSESQKESLLKIDQRFKEHLLAKRNEVMIKRFQIQDLLNDPDATASAIRRKSLELGNLQNEIREKMIEYQIEIRGILTPDQIQRWCTLGGVGPSRQEW